MTKYIDWQHLGETLPFFRHWAGLGRIRKHGAVSGRRQNGRVANELCHTKRRVKADELARIT